MILISGLVHDTRGEILSMLRIGWSDLRRRRLLLVLALILLVMQNTLFMTLLLGELYD